MFKFRGDYSLSLDAKGRIVLPARHREHLFEICNNQIIITIDPDQPCLLLYPLNEWEIIEEKIDALPSLNEMTRRIQHLLIGHATDTEVDTNGRFIIKNSLREHSGLSKKVALVGMGKKFEIWDEAAWIQRKADCMAHKAGGEMPQALAELSL